MAMEEQGGTQPRLTFFPPPQSRQLSGPRCGVGGTLTPSWGCGTLTMAGGPLTAGWGRWGGLGTPLHPAVCDTKPPLTRSSSADLDLDPDSHVPDSSLPNSASRAGRHALLLLEKKVKHFEEAKKKTERFHKHLQQQFLKEQERKMVRRKKASERFEKSLEVFSRGSGKSPVPPAGGLSASEVTPLEHAAATDREGTKRHV
ncbi:uncharacterized protein LOC128146555 [Harpia harpyja]|uniref:uncharacterized protein LOC128146555 n=1 Tax=Harpia harpyja TaxID=202280 RepID=UPI0022B0DA0D|nr:uncharacterized protein LOC128146555 [Harpia harpyja]